ncbi:MAG TPA: PilZ domain-containing protein, partial [Polyangiaceae bacterium]|nr:PilZ domain-containing protein [Polyangiaceae bacterium]
DLQLKGIREAIVASTSANGSTPADAGLSALAKNLAELGRPKLEVRLQSEPDSGLLQLFAQQTGLLEQALGALRTRSADSNGTEQKLSELSATLATLSRQIQQRVGASARRVDVELGVSGPSNLYRSLSGADLLSSGGIFVATYEKPPPLGADVRVSLRFPSGPSCELSGSVAWVRDALGEDAPPGFGVRFADLSEEVRELVQAYSEAREPMLYED